MQRITEAHLLAMCKRLNIQTLSPLNYADERTPGVPFRAHVGHWHLDYAYGGVQLARVYNEAGAVTSYGGHGTKRACADRIGAMLDALSLQVAA